ncbi:MAG: hypothetical protein IPL43_04860 [Micropruina sp.]|nr:hypothetical protein [Micropruina sp.]
MNLHEAADQLYAAPPEEFIASRTALAKQLRTTGEPALARQVAALRKPTRGSWLINLLSRRHPGRLAALGSLAEALLTAHRDGGSGELLRLSAERTRLVAELTRAAMECGREAGYSPTDAIRAEVTGTLTAALTDPEVARLATRGHLSASASPAAFGPVGLFDLGTSSTPPTSAAPVRGPTTGAERRAAELAAEEAQATRAAARAVVGAARQAVERAEAELNDARQAVAELTAELRRAEAQVSARLGALADAEGDATRAEEEAHRASGLAAAAEATLAAFDLGERRPAQE